MKNLRQLKPAVPRRWLFFLAAAVWAYAAYRVFKLAIRFVPEGPFPLWMEITLGLIGFAVFFNFVFLKVSKRHIRRIAAMEEKNPCLFAFFGWKSYLLIAAMATMGIFFARLELLPLYLQGIFYIALSGSLFMSAMMFINAGLLFQEKDPEDEEIEDKMNMDN